MIKAVFLDMDGTVISHKQGKVLESTKDAICQLRAKWHLSCRLVDC